MSEWSVAIDNLEREVENAGVEVRLATEADVDMLRTENASAVVIATGASYEKTGLSLYRPDREGIPGADLDHVFDVGTAAARALDDPESLGKRVLILDETGAHLPFALAEILAKARVDVEIMSPRMFAGERIYRNLDMLYIFPRLKQLGVKITHQHFVEAIRAGEVDVYDIWAGAEAVEKRTGVESVVLSILRVPNDGLYFEAQGLFPDVSRIGDVAAPRDVAAVLVDGETLGRAL